MDFVFVGVYFVSRSRFCLCFASVISFCGYVGLVCSFSSSCDLGWGFGFGRVWVFVRVLCGFSYWGGVYLWITWDSALLAAFCCYFVLFPVF